MDVGPEVGELVVAVFGGHGGRTGRPAGGADLTVLISVLVALNETEDLVDVPADGEVVHGELAEDTLAVDDVSGAKSDTIVFGVLKEAAVVTGNALGEVGHHGHVHGAETALITGLHGVLSVSEVRVDGASNDLGVASLKLGSLVGEIANLGGAHESEVERPEEKHDVFACLVGRQRGELF